MYRIGYRIGFWWGNFILRRYGKLTVMEAQYHPKQWVRFNYAFVAGYLNPVTAWRKAREWEVEAAQILERAKIFLHATGHNIPPGNTSA